MTTHSVWNPQSLKYDYYQAQGALRDGVFAPAPKSRANHRLGITVDEAAGSLPISAKPVGSGDVPYGLISERRSALGSIGLSLDPVRLAIYAGIGWAVWKFVLTRANGARSKRR